MAFIPIKKNIFFLFDCDSKICSFATDDCQDSQNNAEDAGGIPLPDVGAVRVPTGVHLQDGTGRAKD
ncbi:MAG: hypothetical protein WCT04_24180 [Planctomycetota bacterium]